jgi:uncharacterized protein (DUF1330 family)
LKKQFALALSLGAVIGGAIVTGLKAQGTPAAYAVIDVTEVTDPQTFNTVLASTPVGLVPYGGRYVIRTDKVIALEGAPPKRFVVIAFDTVDRAQRWSVSAPVKEINAIRSRAAKWRAFIVEAIPH